MSELKIGRWYWMMLGYAGNDSRHVCIMRNTGRKTAEGISLMFSSKGNMLPQPVTDEYEAMDEEGNTYTVDANRLAESGHIGIGTLRGPEEHVCRIGREAAELLVSSGRCRRETVESVFPGAFDDAERIEGDRPISEHQKAVLEELKAAMADKAKSDRAEEERIFNEKVEECRGRFSYVPFPAKQGEWLSCGEKSRNIKAVLKHEFPGVKFHVSSRNGSTSDSLTVRYSLGPAYKKVLKVVEMFDTGSYDPYTDYHDTKVTPASVVCGGFDYTFVERDCHEAAETIEAILLERQYCVGLAAKAEARKILNDTDFPPDGEIEDVVMTGDGMDYAVKFRTKGDTTPPDGGKTGKAEGVSVTENKEKDGIEIRFPFKPSQTVLDSLKAAGWRWSRRGFWYGRRNEKNMAFAKRFA